MDTTTAPATPERSKSPNLAAPAADGDVTVVGDKSDKHFTQNGTNAKDVEATAVEKVKNEAPKTDLANETVSDKSSSKENSSVNEEEEEEKSDGNNSEAANKTAAPKRKLSDMLSGEESESAGDKAVENAAAVDLADMDLPPKQSLGKGKRARIPNKRYSDILLSPGAIRIGGTLLKPSASPASDDSKMEVIENNTDTTIKDDVVAIAAGVAATITTTTAATTTTTTATAPAPAVPEVAAITSLRARTNTSSPTTKKPKQDIRDPLFLVPFMLGWRRELVYRAITDSMAPRRNGDIYYYTPAGKKVRSLREISENLSKELTLDNFTFLKEPIGLNDTSKEIIRDAKFRSSPLASGGSHRNASKMHSKAPVLTNDSNRKASPRSRPSRSGMANFKVKLTSKSRSDRNKVDDGMSSDDEPPAARRSSALNRKSAGGAGSNNKRSSDSSRNKKRASATTASKSNNNFASSSNNNKIVVDNRRFMDNYLQNISYFYNTLRHVFQYLKVQDLLRAGCVCKMWRDIANHPLLWKTVRMKNSQVHSFDGLANSLKKHGTTHLDLRKMLLPSGGGDEIWPEFSKAIEKVDCLRKIELCRCPAQVVEQLAATNQHLEVINAVTIKCETMSVDAFGAFDNLKELRLKSTSGLTLTSDIGALKDLSSLTHLSLTSIRNLNKLDLSVIGELVALESLDLGECTDFPLNFGKDILRKLVRLEKLRLEIGQGDCHTFEILEAIKDMPKLEQLELVNFDIKSGFDEALGKCSNIKKLLMIPTYISQSAATNHMVLAGVLRLQSTLVHFVWGITLELLKVTELFVDQCNDDTNNSKNNNKKEKKGGSGGSIPVLKPVPLAVNQNNEVPPADDPPEVEILPLLNLQKLLIANLPSTRVKILKIPYHATLRHSITDNVN